LTRLESLLVDLDRLDLPFIAVHIDLAARRLEEVIRAPDNLLANSEID
jgi:hypothetical protein